MTPMTARRLSRAETVAVASLTKIFWVLNSPPRVAGLLNSGREISSFIFTVPNLAALIARPGAAKPMGATANSRRSGIMGYR